MDKRVVHLAQVWGHGRSCGFDWGVESELSGRDGVEFECPYVDPEEVANWHRGYESGKWQGRAWAQHYYPKGRA